MKNKIIALSSLVVFLMLFLVTQMFEISNPSEVKADLTMSNFLFKEGNRQDSKNISDTQSLDRNLTLDEIENISNYNLPKEIVAFNAIKTKALRSKDDEEQATEIASNRNIIDFALEQLNKYDPDENQAIARRKRIVLVDYLAFAMRRGSEKEFVRDMVGKTISTDFEESVKRLHLDIQRGYVGDRIELALALSKVDADAYEQMKQRVKGTALEKIVSYVDQLRDS